MALDANALVDIPAAKDFLQITGGNDDAVIETAINVASDLCERWCGRVLRRRSITNLRLAGPRGPRLLLSGIPIDVTQAVTVTVDGANQTVWRTEADGDPEASDVIVAALVPESALFAPDHLYRAQGWAPCTTGNPYNVLLSYTGGLATPMPDDLKRGCLYVVQKLFRDQKRQLAEVVSLTTPVGSITLLDNALPRMAQLLLSPYRLAAA